jgi:hypothetical protein
VACGLCARLRALLAAGAPHSTPPLERSPDAAYSDALSALRLDRRQSFEENDVDAPGVYLGTSMRSRSRRMP